MESYHEILSDEIALEGLDGITIEALWKRLEMRPKFNMNLDEKSKSYLWKIIISLSDIEFFELEEEREDLLIFNRFDYTDLELGVVLEPDIDLPNIYPHCPIEEEGVKGSCSTYYSRTKIPDEEVQLSLEEVNERWGNKLVLVASQKLRTYALTGNKLSPGKGIILFTYCLLERIGRARYHGEVTHGKFSLQITMSEEAKNIYYHRKFLVKNRLATKQAFHQKSGGSNCSGTLLHLPRFYVEKKSRTVYLMEQLITYLKKRPDHMARYDELKEDFGALSNTFKKLLKTPECQQHINTDIKLPYRNLYPDAKREEWRNKNDKERTIRVIQLANPDVDIHDLWLKNTDENDDEDEDEFDNSSSPDLLLNVPLLNQAYKIVDEAGPNGSNQAY